MQSIDILIARLGTKANTESKHIDSDCKAACNDSHSIKPELTAEQVADYIILYCSKNGSYLTNLQLQRMLYTMQCIYFYNTGSLLFSDTFTASPYGPIIEHIYHAWSDYGSRQLDVWQPEQIAKLSDKTSMISDSIKGFLDDGIKTLAGKTPWDFARVNQADDSPWRAVYDKSNPHKEMPNELLIQNLVWHRNKMAIGKKSCQLINQSAGRYRHHTQ